MQIDIQYTKNPAVGWDILVSAVGDHQEKIARVLATIHASSLCDEDSDPVVNRWRRLFTQKGTFPGDNKVVVTITDDRGNHSSAMEQWS